MVNDPATSYDTFSVPQGISADLTAEGFARGDVDACAAGSQERAARAWSGGFIAESIAAVRDLTGTMVLNHYARDLDVPLEKINVKGGAIAMGDPLGATVAMLDGTALDELERRDARRAVVTVCIRGGMGVATLIDNV